MPTQLCLILANETPVRARVKAALEQRHFEIIEARNCVRALHLMEWFGDALDLMICDMHTAAGGGLAFLQAVREWYPNLPIVLVPRCEDQAIEEPLISKTLMSVESATGTKAPSEPCEMVGALSV